jgi:uncharacterized membrane-anchored protein
MRFAIPAFAALSNVLETPMARTRNAHLHFAFNKVPEVTMVFWAIKILSTTVGETGADYLAVNVGLGTAITDAITAISLIVALVLQLRSRRYVPWIYWLTVVLVSVVGTQITDALTDGAGVSLYASTACFSIMLAAIFWLWYQCEHTLSIRSIDTRRREFFYWAAILCTFALGTGAGDLATEALGLGFTVGSIGFGTLLVATAVAARCGLNRVAAFWITYVLTRPLGASLGDFLSQPRSYGGVGFGTVLTSALFLTVIIMLVTYVSISKSQESGSRPA